MQHVRPSSPSQSWCWEKGVCGTLSFPLMLPKPQGRPLFFTLSGDQFGSCKAEAKFWASFPIPYLLCVSSTNQSTFLPFSIPLQDPQRR